MEDVAQSVEHRFVVPNVAGSSPVILPNSQSIHDGLSAPVAQLDRASDFESAGRRFESCRVYRLHYEQSPCLDSIAQRCRPDSTFRKDLDNRKKYPV